MVGSVCLGRTTSTLYPY